MNTGVFFLKRFRLSLNRLVGQSVEEWFQLAEEHGEAIALSSR
jgi:hypothetical protein